MGSDRFRTVLGFVIGSLWLLSTGPAQSHAGQPATTLAKVGSVPMVAAGAAALPAVVQGARGRDTTPGSVPHDLSDVAAGLAPWGVLGSGMLVGGSLAARASLADRGATVSAWPGLASGGLTMVALGSGLAASGAASPADRGWAVVGTTAWLGAAGMGFVQLHENRVARDHIEGAGPAISYARGTGTYRTGNALLLGGSLSLVPMVSFMAATEHKPALSSAAAAGLGLAGVALLAGTPVRAVGAADEARALRSAGVSIDSTAVGMAWVSMGAAPALGGLGALAASRDAVPAAVILWAGALGAAIAAPLWTGAQHRRNEAAHEHLPAKVAQPSGSPPTARAISLPPVQLSVVF